MEGYQKGTKMVRSYYKRTTVTVMLSLQSLCLRAAFMMLSAASFAEGALLAISKANLPFITSHSF